MFNSSAYIKIALVLLIFFQHSFALSKPMNCSEHPEDTQNNHHYSSQNISEDNHDNVTDHNDAHKPDMKAHSHANEECDTCNHDACSCCDKGLCVSYGTALIKMSFQTPFDINPEHFTNEYNLTILTGNYDLLLRPPII